LNNIDEVKESMDIIDDVTCVILCGGRSTRMGTDKTVVAFQGKALLEHVINIAQSAFSNVVISIHDSSPSENAGLPIIRDKLQVSSPLSGIHAALREVKTDRIIVFAVDMPLVKRELLHLLSTIDPKADVVVPRIQGYLEPLLAVYSVRCADFIEKRFHNGERKVVCFYDDVNVKIIEEEELAIVDRKLRSFININNKAGLRAIEALSTIKVV